MRANCWRLMGYESEGGPLKARAARMEEAASVGWNASQNTWSFLLRHGNCNGRHVICPLFNPTPQHAVSTTLNPAYYSYIYIYIFSKTLYIKRNTGCIVHPDMMRIDMRIPTWCEKTWWIMFYFWVLLKKHDSKDNEDHDLTIGIRVVQDVAKNAINIGVDEVSIRILWIELRN